MDETQHGKALAFHDFSFHYRTQAAPTLHDIGFSVRPGEKVLIVGPSGSGKSTLAHCINGLVPNAFKGVCKGQYVLNGENALNMGIFAISKKVGTVLQDPDGQFVGLSAGEDIAFVLENDCISGADMKRRVAEVAGLVHIDGHLAKAPQDLSGGQKQRVSMAGVLIDDVEILLFDEPLANLDPASGKQAIDLIETLHRTTGKTVLIIEHRLEDVLYRSVDRIVVMDKGRIVADCAPAELLASAILGEVGIREPLYLAALRHAGAVITPDMHPEHLDALVLDPPVNAGTPMKAGTPVETGSPAVSGASAVVDSAASICPSAAADSAASIDPSAASAPAAAVGPSAAQALREWDIRQPVIEPPPTPTALLEVRDLGFHYPEDETRHPVLQEVSFTLRKGECVSLVGRNGAGKSTLAKLICGFEMPTFGTLTYEGRDLSNDSIKQRAERIGYVMQNPNQMISNPMIFDEVALGLRARKVPEAEVKTRVEDTLKTCGLHPFRNWPVSALSFGQKKRLTIASILVLRPQLLILDEPTAGQDFRHYTEIMEFLRRLNRETGLSLLMITHDMHLMLEYTTRALVVSEGRLLADDTPANVLTDDVLIDSASLKRTSLYDLAVRAGIPQPRGFVQHFIDFDRAARSAGMAGSTETGESTDPAEITDSAGLAGNERKGGVRS